MTLKFSIELNETLDLEWFKEAFRDNISFVQKTFPQIKTEVDVEAAIRYVYGNTDENKKLTSIRQYLSSNDKLLQEIAEKISQKLDYPWGDKTITIIPSASPIFPRFIETSTFMVPYYWPINSIIRIFIHEMVHLLYFKKLQDLSGEIIDTEYPSKDWLISEVVAPIIVNSKSLQEYCNEKDTFFSVDGNVASPELIEKIGGLYKKEPDLLKFRNLAINFK